MVLKSHWWSNLRIHIPKSYHNENNISQRPKYRVIHDLRALLQEMIPEVLATQKKFHITKCPILNDYTIKTPNVNYSRRTVPLTSKVAFYIFIQQI